MRVYRALVEKGVKEAKAMDWAKAIADVFGKPKKAAKKQKDENVAPLVELEIEQLAHFSPEELQAIDALVEELAASGEAPNDEQLALLRREHTASDVALFGRMLAASPAFNTDAAAQVAHAISVHKVAVEDDFFTAVDDLNDGEEDAGAGHMGETEFAAGLFYLYLCIDRERLAKNLSGDGQLADRTLGALIRAAATVAPTGKQNSFASRARASFILCECGDAQPRSLSVAFLKPVTGEDMFGSAVERLEQTRARMDKVYGDSAVRDATLNAQTGEGSLEDVVACAAAGD